MGKINYANNKFQNLKIFLIISVIFGGLSYAGTAFTADHITASNADLKNENTAWNKSQLNKEYMSSINKNSCMQKSMNYLNKCSSASCLKTMAGVTGDCVTWAKGSLVTYCKNYDAKYINLYCSPMEDKPRCRFILAIRYAMCQHEK